MSIVSSSTNNAVSRDVAPPRRGWFRIYADLTKARLSALVVLSTAVGFIVAGGSIVDWPRLVLTALGTTLAAASASMINQLMER
ncbi:MAG: hypothetical protein O7G85_13665, partial [Planctomycetota bacterium]|nr:hypothetical protein [Planctomycetota bacterium]